MRIGLLVAMDKEFSLILKGLSSWKEMKYDSGCFYVEIPFEDGSEAILMKCGIGKVNAAVGAMILANKGVDCIISSGVAGGVQKDVLPGQIVIGQKYQYHDVYCGEELPVGQMQGEREYYEAEDGLCKIANTCVSGNVEYKSGLIVSGDKFIDNKVSMGKIIEDFPLAQAVDMESCAIAQVCSKLEIPFISFRIISDCIMNDESECYTDFWDKAPFEMAKNTMSFIDSVLNQYKNKTGR